MLMGSYGKDSLYERAAFKQAYRLYIPQDQMPLRNALWVTFEVLHKNTWSWFLLQVADDISRPRQVLFLKCLFHPK